VWESEFKWVRVWVGLGREGRLDERTREIELMARSLWCVVCGVCLRGAPMTKCGARFLALAQCFVSEGGLDAATSSRRQCIERWKQPKEEDDEAQATRSHSTQQRTRQAEAEAEAEAGTSGKRLECAVDHRHRQSRPFSSLQQAAQLGRMHAHAVSAAPPWLSSLPERNCADA
jgi:hypothetical protein